MITKCLFASAAAGIVTGSEGLPLPYSPQTDDGVLLILLFSFLLSACVLSRSRKFLVQLAKDFLLHRERTSIFTTSTATDMRYLLLLILQTCVLSGLCLYIGSLRSYPALPTAFPPVSLLGIYTGATLLYLFLKWTLYTFFGWIFFDKQKVDLWIESYSTLLYYLGFTLFPFALVIVFFNLNLPIALIIGLILLFLMKILMLYKWLKLFCNNLHGCFLLFLYFCALEIVPCLLLYKGMVEVNEYLTIKI